MLGHQNNSVSLAEKESITIRLDATQKSALDWEQAIQEGLQVIEKGLKILWELDFGLFDRLLHPLANPQQFLSLCLAIEHFRNVIWEPFQHSTFGVLIYKGIFNSRDIAVLAHETALQKWIHERFDSVEQFGHETGIVIEQLQFDAIRLDTFNEIPEAKFLLSIFSRDIGLDYIKQLAGQLPYGVDPVIEWIIDEGLSPAERIIYLNEECYRPLILKVEGVAVNDSVGNIGHVGIYLPPINKFSARWNKLFDDALRYFIAHNISYRLISDESLIMSLEGLDDLFICPSAISYLGKRQLQGFCAAGGRVVLLENASLGLANEIAFKDYCCV
jgi:hypothetical protein